MEWWKMFDRLKRPRSPVTWCAAALLVTGLMFFHPGSHAALAAGSPDVLSSGTAITSSGIMQVLSPLDGETVAGPNVVLEVKVNGFVLTPPSRTNVSGQCHLKVTLDNQKPIEIWQETYTFPNLDHGQHRLTVELVQNNGQSYSVPIVKSITFNVVGPVPAPAVSVTSPANDVKSRGRIMVKLATENFKLVPPGTTPTPGTGYFMLQIDDQKPFPMWYDTFELPLMQPGTHRLAVSLVDAAGRPITGATGAALTFIQLRPIPWKGIGLGAVLLVAAAAAGWWWTRYRRAHPQAAKTTGETVRRPRWRGR